MVMRFTGKVERDVRRIAEMWQVSPEEAIARLVDNLAKTMGLDTPADQSKKPDAKKPDLI